ncbi:MAG: hypothetical protein NTX28_15195 [Novosphingobium sp.]|nr:hypothetical protein [Novosphingobium sp.]
MRAIPTATMKQLLSASGLALATALVAAGPRLAAQGFNAIGTVVAGNATINSTPTTSAITVLTPSAVINWVPTDIPTGSAPYNFQSSFQTTTYQNDLRISDFAVLNRIIPTDATRPIRFNGTVVSQLQQISGPTVQGGTLFFYSPGGILISGSSIFNVGNLVLTTSDLAYDSTGAFNTGESYVFKPAAVAGSQIVVSAGAQLNASVDGSYMAMVAPSVVNNGTINVNGAAALVAADAATIRFSPSGLFDIEVSSGTSASGEVLANNGVLGGPAAASATSFFHRVYMVAVPKNDAITMAIGAGSTLGFDIAGAADVQGNTVVLSAGQNVTNGEISTRPAAGGGSGLASITGGDALFSSAVDARTTGTINLEATQPDGMTFASQALLHAAGGDSSITARTGSFVNFNQFLLFSGSVTGTSAKPNAQGGNIALRAVDGGTITASGSVDLISSGFGAPSTVAGTNGGNGTGGAVLVEALNGGKIIFNLDLQAKADGSGGFPETGATGIGGGKGIGGTVTLRSGGSTNSSISIAGGLIATATGLGATGNGCATCLFDGASGTGGTVALLANGTGNALGIVGLTDISVQSFGGVSAFGNGGSATGGTITASATNGAEMNLRAFNGYADAQAGASDTGIGGSATGGSVDISASGAGAGGIRATGDMVLNANATGGLGQSATSPGGAATGGAITVSARDEKFVAVEGNLFANSNAKGGIGFGGPATGTGGAVTFEAARAGFMSVSGFAGLAARGEGGDVFDAPVGGLGTGGVATIRSTGGIVRLAGDVTVNAEGRGGAQLTNGMAGAGQGGTAQIVIGASGSVDLQQSVQVIAEGVGGFAGSGPDTIGGNGTGGNARLSLGGGSLDIAGELRIDSAGSGGGGGDRGGNGLGGTTSITQTGNALTVGDATYVGATGTGAAPFFGPTGGSGTGGSIVVSATGSTADFSTAGTATFEATGYGAQGTTAGTGTGGAITVTAAASTISAGAELQVFSEGQGGSGSFLGSSGADGTGGSITLTARGNALGASEITAPTLNISAAGRGGDGTSSLGSSGGNGATGRGGNVSLISAPDGGTIDAQQLTVNATGNGGLGGSVLTVSGPGQDAGSGGSAVGGRISFGSSRGTGTDTGGFVFGDATINAGATGASGQDGGTGQPAGRGGSGGNAEGGSIAMLLDAGGSSLSVSGTLQLLANATGGKTGVCSGPCVVTPGTATGGAVQLGSGGLTTGNTITVGFLQLSAFAEAGSSSAANGAGATGGSVLLGLGSGMALTAQTVSLTAFARGGDSTTDQISGLSGGSAIGGSAQFTAAGTSSAAIGQEVGLYANAIGGLSQGPAGIGGNGTGGTVRLASSGGAIGIEAGLVLQANGIGGNGQLDSATGTGGSAVGGNAVLSVGSLTQLGNGGSISVLGLVNSSADAGAGAGFVAGSATGGTATVMARQGTLALNDVLVTANAFGGGGMNGGAGGGASGGDVQIAAHNAIEGAALIRASSLTAQANARGGDGGEILDPNAVGATGGLAQGGSISVLGSAGNGSLDIDLVTASADATGGTGGTAVFEVGGTGGLATGGAIGIGVISGIDTGAINTGSARFGTISATASATGGSGGTAEFVGGNGGNASAGAVGLQAQGGQVLIGAASTFANALGGAGGSSITVGNGGNATIGAPAASPGGVGITIAGRTNQPGQRGSVTAGDLALTAAAVGGSGTINGSSALADSALRLLIDNGNLAVSNLSLTASAAEVSPLALPDSFSIINGSAQIAAGLTIQTPNAFSLTLDNGAATADMVSITAGNWVLAGPVPATLGTLTGTSALQLSSGLDLVGYANLQSDSQVNLSAAGRIAFGAVRTLGSIVANAGTSLTLDDASSQQDITLTAGTDMVTGIITALGRVSIGAGGNVTTGAIIAGTGVPSASALNQIAINAGGNIATDTLAATGDVLLNALGTIATGRITAYDALVLGRGDITIGGFNGVNRVLIADREMASARPGPAPTKEQIFSAAPIATAGSVGITGPSTLGSLRIAAGTTVALAALDATGNVGISSTGNAALATIVSGGAVTVSSNAGAVQAGAISGSGGVSINGGAGLALGAVDGASVSLASGATLAAGDITAGSGGATVLSAGNAALGNVVSTGLASLSSTGGVLTAASISGSAGVVASGAAGLELGAVTGAAVSLTSGATLVAGDIAAGSGGLAVQAAANAVLGNVISTGLANLSSTGGALTVGNISGSTDILANGSAGLALGAVNGSGVSLTSGGTLSAADVTAGPGGLAVVGAGNVVLGGVVSAGSANLSSTTGSLTALSIDGSSSVSADGATALDLGTVRGASVSLTSGGTLTASTVSGSSGVAAAGANGVNLGAVNGSAVSLTSGATLRAGDVTAGLGGASVLAAGDATLGIVTSAGSASLSSTGGTLTASRIDGSLNVAARSAGGVNLGAVNGSAVFLTSGASLVTANVSSGSGGVSVSAAGNATLGNVVSAGFTTLTSSGGILKAGNIDGSSSVLASGAAGLDLGAVSGTSIALRSGGAILAGNLGAGSGGLRIDAGTDLQAGDLVSAQDVSIVAGGNIGAGLVQGIDALVLAGGHVQLGGMAITGRGLIANASMAAAGSQPSSATPAGSSGKDAIFAGVPVATGGSVAIAGNAAAGSLRIASGALVTVGDVLASGNIGVTGGGGRFGSLRSTGGNIELLAQTGSLSATSIDARFDVLARAGGGLGIQTIVGRDVALLSGGNVQVGSVRAGLVLDAASGALAGATGRLLIANAAMLPGTALPGSIGYAALFAAAPVAAGGTVDIGRSAVAGRIASVSSGAFRGAALTGFERIDVTSGGAVTVAERWTAPAVQITATDIAIVNNGSTVGASGQPVLSGIRTTADGRVDIVSTSSGSALIGDGLTGQGGFALSSDEIGLISTNRLTIAATDSPSNAIDMQIGNLALTAGGSIGAGTLSGAAGKIILATGNAASQATGGTIRVTGAINGTGFGSGNILEFSTGTFELDAATGSISLASTGTALGGIAEFNAARIHVASGDILAKLAADPLYSGRIADLNAPALVQRPEGVLRALGLDFHPTGSLYIQNTGTVLNPAGFFADIAFTDVTAPANAPPKSISIVVNGAFQTPTGIVSGKDAHALAVAGIADAAVLADDSQINGCLFSLPRCAIFGRTDGEPDVIGAIASQIAFTADDPLGSTPGMAEGEAEEESDEADVQLPTADGDSEASPIVPPPVIINDAALGAPKPIEESVTGGGNSALYGAGTSGNGNLQGENR